MTCAGDIHEVYFKRVHILESNIYVAFHEAYLTFQVCATTIKHSVFNLHSKELALYLAFSSQKTSL